MGRIPFNQQIKNFENTLDQITGNLGAVQLAQALGRSIFFVGMGSNDYLNNYLMPNYPTRNEYDGQQYADLLIQQYSQQLTVRPYQLFKVTLLMYANLTLIRKSLTLARKTQLGVHDWCAHSIFLL